jgi:hypothetical protein
MILPDIPSVISGKAVANIHIPDFHGPPPLIPFHVTLCPLPPVVLSPAAFWSVLEFLHSSSARFERFGSPWLEIGRIGHIFARYRSWEREKSGKTVADPDFQSPSSLSFSPEIILEVGGPAGAHSLSFFRCPLPSLCSAPDLKEKASP